MVSMASKVFSIFTSILLEDSSSHGHQALSRLQLNLKLKLKQKLNLKLKQKLKQKLNQKLKQKLNLKQLVTWQTEIEGTGNE